MADSITLRLPDEVEAVLSSSALVPPAAPATIGTRSTATLRSAMARFASDEAHLERRQLVVELIATFDLTTLASLAAQRTRTRLHGGPIDAVAELAGTVPTEVLLTAHQCPGRELAEAIVDDFLVAGSHQSAARAPHGS